MKQSQCIDRIHFGIWEKLKKKNKRRRRKALTSSGTDSESSPGCRQQQSVFFTHQTHSVTWKITPGHDRLLPSGHTSAAAAPSIGGCWTTSGLIKPCLLFSFAVFRVSANSREVLRVWSPHHGDGEKSKRASVCSDRNIPLDCAVRFSECFSCSFNRVSCINHDWHE